MVTREKLYALVWSEPMIRAAERYDVSGPYLARVCTLLNVPRPPRGHWQKLAVGKAAPQEALPEAFPGDQVSWNEKGRALQSAPPPRPRGDPRTSQRSPGRAAKRAEGVHPLIRGTLAEFRRSRPMEGKGYLKPFKKLLPDVIASGPTIERALDVASKLYNELESAGARAVIAPADQRWHGMAINEREVPAADSQRAYDYRGLWSPMRPTVAFFEDASIGIAVVEMSENVVMRYLGRDRSADGYIRESEYQANQRRYRYDHSWTTNKDLPCGRLPIVAFSAEGVKWSQTWQEKGDTRIDAVLQRIAKEVFASVPDIITMVAEARCQAEIRHQEYLAAEDRWKRQEDRWRIEESTKQSQEALGQVIER